MGTGKKRISLMFSVLLLTVYAALPARALDYKFNMTYIYFGSPANYTSLVDNTQNSLREAAPNYFSLDAGGGACHHARGEPRFCPGNAHQGHTCRAVSLQRLGP